MAFIKALRMIIGGAALVIACLLFAYECTAVLDPAGTLLARKIFFLQHTCTLVCHALVSLSALGFLAIAILLLMRRGAN